MIFIKNDDDLLTECGYLKNDINSLQKEIQTFLTELNENSSDDVKNEEESVIEMVLEK